LQTIENRHRSVNRNAKKMYDKSESTRSVSFVTQGNALQRSAEEKQKQVDKLLKNTDEQQLVLKQMKPALKGNST